MRERGGDYESLIQVNSTALNDPRESIPAA
jgi:hypothetical protein